MNPSTLKKLDLTLTKAFCSVAQVCAGVGRRMRGGREPKDCLIIRPGGMGDLICAHMACERLGLSLAKADWLIEKRSEPWAKQAGMKYLCYDRDLIEFIKEGLARYRVVINTEQLFGLSQVPAILARHSSGKTVCFKTNRGRGWSEKAVPYDPYDEHEVASFSGIIALALGISTPKEPLVRTRKEQDHGINLVGMAGLASPSRRLSKEKWVQLILEWAGGRTIAFVCAPEDKEYCSSIGSELKNKLDFVGVETGSFSQVCKAISHASDLLTMDGGMAHIASYYGVRSTVLFTSGRDLKWAPLGSGSRKIKNEALACRPCTLFGQTPPCPNSLQCHDLRIGE